MDLGRMDFVQVPLGAACCLQVGNSAVERGRGRRIGRSGRRGRRSLLVLHTPAL